MPATLRVMGAARGVTGSAYHLDLGESQVLVDCGIFQGEREAQERNRRPPVECPAELGAVVLTHGHLDHVGRLPLLAREGFDGPVYGQAATLEIAEVVLRDSLKIARSGGTAIFDEEDMERILERFRPLPYREAREIAPGVRATLFDAGHILGSASVLVETREGSILLSGDLGRRGSPILRDPNTRYPEGLRVDHVVVESTYGDRQHPGRPDMQARLREALKRALGDGGKVIIPAFSIGRTQEIIYYLRGFYAEGEFEGVPVVVDSPMGIDVTALYERHAECYDAEAKRVARAEGELLAFDDLYGAKGRKQSEAAHAIRGPAIVIAGSGMCTGGRVLGYLEELLPDPKTDVILIGYQARGTLGRRLLEGAHEVTIDGRAVTSRAQVTQMAGFSAHADRDELLDWLRAVPGPGGEVFVCHGEAEQADAFAAFAGSELGVKARAPEEGEPLPLWG